MVGLAYLTARKYEDAVLWLARATQRHVKIPMLKSFSRQVLVTWDELKRPASPWPCINDFCPVRQQLSCGPTSTKWIENISTTGFGRLVAGNPVRSRPDSNRHPQGTIS